MSLAVERRRVVSGRAACAGLALVLAFTTNGIAATLADRMGDRFEPLSRSFASAVGRSLPIVAASAGFRFVFDPETGAFEPVGVSFGQLLVERAEPLGAGYWSASLSYQHVVFDRFEGKDLDRLSDRHPVIAPDGVPLYTLPDSKIAIEAHEVTASITYGVTPTIDLNLTVPTLNTGLDREDLVVGLFPGAGAPQQSGAAASKTGIGDVYLRGKWSFLGEGSIRAAAGLSLRMPTAEAENFHGVGSFGAGPYLYASTRPWEVRPWLPFQAHVNLGLDLDADDVSQSEGRWALGMDVGIGRRARAALAFLGRHAFDRLAPPTALELRRCLAPVAVCQSDPLGSPKGRLPVFGFRGERADHVDLSVGGRVQVWRDTVILFANVLLPLTDEGLRTEPIPLGGMEVTF